MTKWITGWKKRDWQLSTGGPVKNKEELMILDELCQQIDIIWVIELLFILCHCIDDAMELMFSRSFI